MNSWKLNFLRHFVKLPIQRENPHFSLIAWIRESEKKSAWLRDFGYPPDGASLNNSLNNVFYILSKSSGDFDREKFISRNLDPEQHIDPTREKILVSRITEVERYFQQHSNNFYGFYYQTFRRLAGNFYQKFIHRTWSCSMWDSLQKHQPYETYKGHDATNCAQNASCY